MSAVYLRISVEEKETTGSCLVHRVIMASPHIRDYLRQISVKF